MTAEEWTPNARLGALFLLRNFDAEFNGRLAGLRDDAGVTFATPAAKTSITAKMKRHSDDTSGD